MANQNGNSESINLDDLAVMMRQQFDDVQKQFDELSRKIDERPTIAQIGLKLDNMEKRLKEDLGQKPIGRDRILNTKTDTVAIKLNEKQIFTKKDVLDIRTITPVAVLPFMD